jgi:hypothetical protein
MQPSIEKYNMKEIDFIGGQKRHCYRPTFEKAVGNNPSGGPVLGDGHSVQGRDVADKYRVDIESFIRKHG